MEIFSFIARILQAVMFYSFVKMLIVLFSSLYRIFYPYWYASQRDLKTIAGADWAVITGASDGIGKAYAVELAKRGFNLVLISRNQNNLDRATTEISNQFSEVQVKTIVFDFTNANANDYELNLFAVLRQLQIGLLVNNVGMMYKVHARLDMIEGGDKRLTDMLVVNTLPATLLSAFVLKQMVDRNNKGVIINISSSVAYYPVYYLAVYSAAKKYLCWLSSIMRKEYAHTNIIIQTVCPMYVDTQMTKDFGLSSSSLLHMKPENFAAEAIKTVGVIAETAGCMAHQIQVELLYSWMPDFVMDAMNVFVAEQVRKKML